MFKCANYSKDVSLFIDIFIYINLENTLLQCPSRSWESKFLVVSSGRMNTNKETQEAAWQLQKS